MPVDAQKEKKTLDRRMPALRKAGYFPDELLDLVEAVYNAQIEARTQADVPDAKSVEVADAQARAQGAPLVDRETLGCDLKQAGELFDKIMELMSAHKPTAEACKVIAEAIESGELDKDEVFDRFRKNDQAFFTAWASKTPTAPSTLVFLAKSSLTPGLAAASEKLNELRAEEKSWGYGHCPVCGGLPLIGELRGKEGAKVLTCSYCLTDYQDKRLCCPFCGEEEQKKLLYFTAKEEPGYRVDVCKTCKMYIKTIDFRNLDKKALPLLDDLASLSLDVLARKEQYNRPTASGWGF